MPLKLTSADKTHPGRQREQNEDNGYRHIESTKDGDCGLFIVADGMGGYQAGEVASRIAVEKISHALNTFFQPITEQPTIKLSPIADAETSSQPEDDQATVELDRVTASPASKDRGHKTRKLPDVEIGKDIERKLRSAVEQANAAIIQHGEQKASARGLGCTVTAVLIREDKAYIANVGDSRTYLLRKGKLSKLTQDHSLVAKLVEAKQIEPEEAYSHPQRNLIYRSLGAGHKTVEVDVFHEPLQAGDSLLLCSDGLWEMVRDQDLLKILNAEHTSPQTICDSLIELANEHGGEDNITAVVVQISAR